MNAQNLAEYGEPFYMSHAAVMVVDTSDTATHGKNMAPVACRQNSVLEFLPSLQYIVLVKRGRLHYRSLTTVLQFQALGQWS